MRKKEKNQRDIKRGAAKQNFFEINHSDDPGRKDNGGQKVNGEHFIKLKQFIVIRGEDKRHQNKKQVKRVFNHFLTKIFPVHGFSIS